MVLGFVEVAVTCVLDRGLRGQMSVEVRLVTLILGTVGTHTQWTLCFEECGYEEAQRHGSSGRDLDTWAASLNAASCALADIDTYIFARSLFMKEPCWPVEGHT